MIDIQTILKERIEEDVNDDALVFDMSMPVEELKAKFWRMIEESKSHK